MLIVCLSVSIAMSCTRTTGYSYRTQSYKLRAKGEQTNLLHRRTYQEQRWYPPRRMDNYHPPEHPHFNNTHFCPIKEMEQLGAHLVSEEQYPWIARVVHCRHENAIMAPLICTAAAIQKKTFITAARCLVAAKAEFTTILYKDGQIGVKAFIFPMKPSKQLFDDVGLIVVWSPWKNKTVNYELIALSRNLRSNDNSYDFFENFTTKSLTVVGYVEMEEFRGTHNLYKLENMHASNRVCNAIYPMRKNSNDYWVPCAHSCGPEEHYMNSETCRRYLLGLGHMVVDEETNELIGVVTWTCANSAGDILSRQGLPLPLGLAVPNRKTLTLDTECAEMISLDWMHYNAVTPGHYRKLCIDMYGGKYY